MIFEKNHHNTQTPDTLILAKMFSVQFVKDGTHLCVIRPDKHAQIKNKKILPLGGCKRFELRKRLACLNGKMTVSLISSMVVSRPPILSQDTSTELGSKRFAAMHSS